MLAIRTSEIEAKIRHPEGMDLRHISGHALEANTGNHVLALMGHNAKENGISDFRIPLKSLDSHIGAPIGICNQRPKMTYPAENLSLLQTEHLLLGAIQLPAEKIEFATRKAYRLIQNTIKQNPGFQLIRLWNYFPGINLADKGIERYRLFSRGRHDVLASSGYRMSSDLPAASAVGSESGPLVIHFLAGNGDMSTVENPRQVSAYRYPRTYGPRSPSFSRAVIYTSGEGRQLFLSGTASIIGHETIAPLDPERQTRVTLENLSALLDHAGYPTINSLGTLASWIVYVREPSHIDLIRPLIADQIHPDSRIVYLQGDICRKELMVEIEGTIFC